MRDRREQQLSSAEIVTEFRKVGLHYMFKKIGNILKSRKRPFDAFQIEVSTYCSLECQMCPRTFFAEEWIFRNMSMDTFGNIAKYFGLTTWVYLQGWGEPLENEHFMDMLRIAREAGCRVGVTTNGVHLTDRNISRLLDGGIDMVVLSSGGVSRESHEGLRRGSDAVSFIGRIERLIEMKRDRGMKRPTVKISLIMTRLNMTELPDMVPLAARMGIDEVMVTNIDYLPRERCNVLRAFHHESPTEVFEKSLEEMHALGKELGVAVRSYPLEAREVPMCEANPLKNIFFSVDGAVAPCVYLRIPKRGDIPRIFMDSEYEVPQTIFGNIDEGDLWEIWDGEGYRSFRKIYERRLAGSFSVSKAFDLFSGSATIHSEDEKIRDIPPLPEVCRTCYKAYGL